jgi:SOS response regulatory protein OraA/RecX
VKHGLELLSRRDHFTPELSKRLSDAGFPIGIIESTLQELTSQGLLDDVRLAEDRVRRWRADGRSEAECRARLAGREVPPHIIDGAVRAVRDPEVNDELQAAIMVLQKAMGAGSSPPPAARLAGRLGRRGFEPDTIRAALRHCGIEDPSAESPADGPYS